MRFLQSMGCLAPATIMIYGVIGLLILWQFGGQILNYFGSMGWEQTPGMIVSSEVIEEWDTTGNRYVGQVVYTYEADGVTHEGNQLNLGGTTYLGNPDDAARLIAPYSVGTSVMPYVDPTDPTRAVLDRHIADAVWWLVGIGGALVLLSLGLGTRHIVINNQRGAANAL